LTNSRFVHEEAHNYKFWYHKRRKYGVLSALQKWLGLSGIPRGFIPQIYTVLRKLPQTQ